MTELNVDDRSAVGTKAGTGVLWLLLLSVFGRAVTIVSQIVLAWLLTPADFGKIALALTVTALPTLLVSAGTLEFLILRHKALALWATTLFWLSICVGTLAGVVMFALAPIASWIYASDLNGLVGVIALGAPMTAASTVSVAILRSSMKFAALASIGALETILMPILTVFFALLGFGAYSFAIPIPLVAAIRTMVVILLAPVKIAASPNIRRWPLLAARVSPLLGTRLVHAAVGQGDCSILGALTSESTVGLYSFAIKIAAQPISALAANTQIVVFPALSRFRGDPKRQSEAALSACRMLAVIIFPTCFVQAAIAEPLVHLIFGSKWLGAIPLMEMLSIGFAFAAVSWVSAALIESRGEFLRDFVYTSLVWLPFFGFVFVGARCAEAVGVAAAVSGYYAICLPLYSWLVFRDVGVELKRLLAAHTAPAVIAAAAVGAATSSAYLIESWVGDGLGKILWIIGAAAVSYLAILRFSSRDLYDELQDRTVRAAGSVLSRLNSRSRS